MLDGKTFACMGNFRFDETNYRGNVVEFMVGIVKGEGKGRDFAFDFFLGGGRGGEGEGW